MTDIEEIVRRAQAELVETPPLPHRGSQGSTVQHEVPKDYDGLCELERPYYAPEKPL